MTQVLFGKFNSLALRPTFIIVELSNVFPVQRLTSHCPPVWLGKGRTLCCTIAMFAMSDKTRAGLIEGDPRKDLGKLSFPSSFQMMPLLWCCQCQPMLSFNNHLVSMATKVAHTHIACYNVTMYPQRLSLYHTVNVIQCNKHQLAYIATQTMQSRTQNIPFSFLYHPQSQLKMSSIH